MCRAGYVWKSDEKVWLTCSFNLTMWNKVATTKRHADKEIFGANAGANAPKK